MRKFYSLLFTCLFLFAFTGTSHAEVGPGVIKIKTNKAIDKVIKMDIMIFKNVDSDGDVNTSTPEEGVNISFEGAEKYFMTSTKVYLTVKAPEIVIHGDVYYFTIVNQGITDIDVSQADKLGELRVNNNPLQSLNLPNRPNLKQLWASYCSDLSSVNLTGTDNLNSISLQGSRVASLDLAGKSLITNLNLGENPNLNAIDVSNLPKLEELWVNGNGLTTLDVSGNPLLNHLECSRNNLTALDVSQNTELAFFACWGNKIEGQAMDNLIASLVEETDGATREFCVYNKFYTQNNTLTKAQAQAVKARGWKPRQAKGTAEFFMWEDYEGSDVNTGIDGVKNHPAGADLWFDLQGRRTTKPVQPGVYIHNGKKILIGRSSGITE